MRKVFELSHSYIVEELEDETVHNTKLLGFFSSEENCIKAISYYIQQPGFKKFPDDFEIFEIEADIDDYNNIPGEFGNTVYYLSHEWYDGEYDHVTDVGYYSTQQKADAAEKLFRLEKEYVDHPEGFVIDAYTIDQMEWKEGFCSAEE